MTKIILGIWEIFLSSRKGPISSDIVVDFPSPLRYF